MTIFESINASGRFPLPPLILVQGQKIMVDWYPKGLPKRTHIIPIDNGFTSHKIALVFLEHYIRHSDAGPKAD